MKKFKKRTDYLVTVEKVSPGTTCYNHLEDTNYVATPEKCIMITGTQNEQWMATEEKLLKTYIVHSELNPGISIKVSPKPDGNVIWAERLEEDKEIKTSWGDVLHAKKGDYQAWADKGDEPDPEDTWSINGGVFINTYEEV